MTCVPAVKVSWILRAAALYQELPDGENVRIGLVKPAAVNGVVVATRPDWVVVNASSVAAPGLVKKIGKLDVAVTGEPFTIASIGRFTP